MTKEEMDTKLSKIESNTTIIYNRAKKDAYDEFWDNFQDFGNRTDYQRAFFSQYDSWNLFNFKPKWNLFIYNGSYMFSDFSNIGGGDLKQHLIDCEVRLDTSKAINLQYMFYNSKLTNIPVVDTHNCNDLSYLFSESSTITVDKLILKDLGGQTLTNIFYDCVDLQNIVIEGTITYDGLDLSTCELLSGDSIESFINALSSTTSNLSVNFSQIAVNNATFTSGNTWSDLVTSKSNWTITLI